MEYYFQWDPAKAISNLRKHNIGFEQAVTVFKDPRAMSLYDSHHSRAEDRWITLGISESGGLLVVNHTYEEIRGQGVRIRIISSRKATKREITQYNG